MNVLEVPKYSFESNTDFNQLKNPVFIQFKLISFGLFKLSNFFLRGILPCFLFIVVKIPPHKTHNKTIQLVVMNIAG